jgi:pimeloyl-ACP methyl ester carboxylesterase
MTRALPRLLLATLLLAAWPAWADTEISGQTDGGAYYQIVVPDHWNGTLILWNHGFDLDPIGPITDLGPIAELQLAGDYAVATTSLRENGWALFKSVQDLQLLLDVFNTNFGPPDEILLTGASMGGLVTAQAIEKANLGNVTGALNICGAVAGSRNWDAALDDRLIYDYVCQKSNGGQIPGGATGLEKNTPLTKADVEAAINACTGLDLPEGQRTNKQKKAIRQFTKWTTVPEEMLQTALGYSTLAFADLIHDRGKMKSKQAVGNAEVDYGVKRLDKRLERVTAKRNAERKLLRNYTPTGKVGNVKIVSIHTDKDGLVFVENESEYASVVPPQNLTVGIVVEDTPTHCGFTSTEALGAFSALLDWVDGGPQPTAATLQDECESLQPFLNEDCRFDPNYVIKDLDTRIRPRTPQE